MQSSRSFGSRTARILVAALILAASNACAQVSSRLLFDIAGGNGGFAVSGSGEWFIKNDSGADHIWTHMGNVFAASGVEANGRVVCGIATYSNWGLFVVCEDGSFFLKNATMTKNTAAKDHVWSYSGNVFESAGRPPPAGVSISSLVVHWGAGADLLLSNGDWYDKTNSTNDFEWHFLGNIYAMAGVVRTGAQSLGSLKRAFH